MRSGSILTQLVQFTNGLPGGDVTWNLVDGSESLLSSGVVTPAQDAVSVVIEIDGQDNTLTADEDLVGSRELRWSYKTDGVLTTGERRYRLEAFLPFGVSVEGVRRKLGVEPHELNPDEVDLAGAFARFREVVTPAAMAEVQAGYPEMVAADAIEASAALSILPSMAVRVAKKESSGTDQYQRDAVDWAAIGTRLEQYVADGYRIVNPVLDLTADTGALLVTVVRADPVTGN